MSADTACRRISVKPGEADSPRVERLDGVWRVRSAEAVRQILRERDATAQAGFNSESIPDGTMADEPILFMDGEPHRQQQQDRALLRTEDGCEPLREPHLGWDGIISGNALRDVAVAVG